MGHPNAQKFFPEKCSPLQRRPRNRRVAHILHQYALPHPTPKKKFWGTPNPQGPKYLGSKFFFRHSPPQNWGNFYSFFFRKMFRPHAPYKCPKFREIRSSIHGDILAFICQRIAGIRRCKKRLIRS